MLKVKTILNNDFDELCFKLANEVISDDYKPDVVIGIKNGGAIIAKEVLKYLNITCKPKYYELTVQHRCTKRFEKIHIDKLFGLIPKSILNAMRIGQISFYEFLYVHFNYIRKYYIEENLNKDLQFYLHQGGRKILIIDDAIDSGQTMNRANIYISWFGLPMPGHKPNQIKFAVATTTYKDPLIKPHYSLYKRTILRLPWAFDVHKGRT